ncbi:PP2C family serine/threonine-protein phosphatase [Shewanella algae]|uniref:PP2C family serine/threonine-protein phosphatase n=1 Tax=Shewanella algae TaxID=38313 RepID=UPI00118328E1|nr:PP2C family serine/threonine-protein phosphatase [Shewanella algae]
MKLSFQHCSVRGPGHIRSGLPNQDYLMCGCWGPYWAAVVCDGMGSRTRSDIGSREAAKAALQSVKMLGFEVNNRVIVETLYRQWLARLKQLHIQPTEAVTTCILVWGVSDGSFRYGHLGDGLLASPRMPISCALGSAFSNETTGLGISKHLSDWQFGSGTLREHDNSLFLMTDGISEDLTNPTAFCGYLSEVLLHKNTRQAKKWLHRQLSDWPTPGHSDDKTLLMLRHY